MYIGVLTRETNESANIVFVSGTFNNSELTYHIIFQKRLGRYAPLTLCWGGLGDPQLW